MAKVERDEEREERMTMEIVVDAYGSEEQAMFVEIEWESNVLAVPLVQLDAPEVDAETQQAIADWRYWVN
jgi:hypothetical protein